MIKATVNQSIYEVKEGTTLSDLAKQVQLPQEPIILLAYMDGKLRELFTPMTAWNWCNDKDRIRLFNRK